MKILKSFSLILLLICVSITINAQSPKTTGEGTVPIIPFYLPCFDEMVTGEVNFSYIEINSFYQEKMWGTLVGETTGNEYTVNQLYLYNWHPSVNYTDNVSLKFRLDGKLVFIQHFTYHATMNANGELVVVFENGFSECK